MSIKIEIQSMAVDQIAGTSQKTGKQYSFCKQEAWFHNGKDPYPSKIELMVDRPDKAYAVGIYSLDPASVYVDRNNRLAVSPILVPVAPAVQAADYKAASGGK